jgi:hypothetical protein
MLRSRNCWDWPETCSMAEAPCPRPGEQFQQDIETADRLVKPI